MLRSERKRVLIMHSKRLQSVAAFFFTLVLVCSSVAAHDLPMNSIMNGFVKVEPKQMDLVVRVPLDLLRGVPFPVKESQYEVGASGPLTQLSLLLLKDGFLLSEDGVRLAPSSSSGRLSPPSDR